MITAIRRLTMQSHMSYHLHVLSAWQDYKKNVYLILEQLKFSEILRITIVALHKDGRGYKKFGRSLELS